MLTERKVENPFFGENGFGDFEYDWNPDLSPIKSEHGVQAMYRLAKEVSHQFPLKRVHFYYTYLL